MKGQSDSNEEARNGDILSHLPLMLSLMYFSVEKKKKKGTNKSIIGPHSRNHCRASAIPETS